MRKITIALLSFVVLITFSAKAQFSRTPWTIGLGVNVVDDNNHQFTKIFDMKSSWNMVPYPSRISVEKQLDKGWSVEAEFTYNQYKSSNIIFGSVGSKQRNYIALDIVGKYDLNELVGETYWFDPYLFLGHTYSFIGKGRSSVEGEFDYKKFNSFYLDGGFGFNLWITKEIGMNFQAAGKFAYNNKPTANNHTQYSISLLYKLGGTGNKFFASNQSSTIVEHIRKIKRGGGGLYK